MKENLSGPHGEHRRSRQMTSGQVFAGRAEENGHVAGPGSDKTSGRSPEGIHAVPTKVCVPSAANGASGPAAVPHTATGGNNAESWQPK